MRDTGADLALTPGLLGEALIWLGYHLVVRARSGWMRLARRNAPRIWFTPRSPRPWYLVWSAMAWAGLRIARTPEDAEARFAFQDTTWAAPCGGDAAAVFNGRCRDISKSRVSEASTRIFGSPLAVDPEAWSGEAVEKSERNGLHDGRIVRCPAPRRAGFAYQRLIDTREGDFTYDLRTACIGGRAAAVWIKRKSVAARFAMQNVEVTLHDPADVFSTEELAQIGRFAQAMEVDWAGLDILRDRATGALHVVDVNPTDVGPIITLSFADKIRSTIVLARALDAIIPPRADKPQAAGRRNL